MTLRYRHAVRTGVAFVIALAVILVLAISINQSFGLPFNLSAWPPGQDYSLSASFTDANGLNRGADVVIAGHSIGQVTTVNQDQAANRALVTMRITSQYAPIHRGSVARIRYSTLLAQKYLELAPVVGGEAIASGGSIPSNQTITPVDFDQFLSSLDQTTRQRLQVVIQQSGTGLEGRAATINDLLDELHALSMESKPGLDTIASHGDDLSGTLAGLSIASQRLATSRVQLGQLIQNADDVNATLADQNVALTRLITHLANVMTDFNLALDGNESNLHQAVVLLDPLVGSLTGQFTTVESVLRPNLGALNSGFQHLTYETESAVSQRDANGNFLRQYLVAADTGCSQYNTTFNPNCGGGQPNPDHQPAAGARSGPPPSSGPVPTRITSPPPGAPCDPIYILVGLC